MMRWRINKTLILENNEYKQHVVELQHQNEDLKHGISLLEQQHRHNESHLKPLLTDHISAIELELNDNDIQLARLNDELREKSKLIKELKSENIALQEQNEKYRVVLENNNKQKQLLKQSSAETQLQLRSYIAENEQLRQEMHHLQTFSLKNLKSPTHSRCTSPTPVIMPDATPRFGFLRSMDNAEEYAFPTTSGTNIIHSFDASDSSCPNIPAAININNVQPPAVGRMRTMSASAQVPTPLPATTPIFGSAFVSDESACSVKILANRVTQYGIDMMDSIHEYGNNGREESIWIDPEEVEGLKEKIRTLEMQNADLIQKLAGHGVEVVTEDEEEKCGDDQAPYKFIDEEDFTSCDESDSEEMEGLFEKCHGELLGHSSSDHERLKELQKGLIEKFRILWWEFQLHSVDNSNGNNRSHQNWRLNVIKEEERGYQ